MKKIESVAVIGMGALGILFGKEIMDGVGRDAVCYIMDKNRYEKYKGAEVVINGEPVIMPMKPAEEAKPVDLILVATKGYGLEEAMETMKNCVADHTIIISVLNGISSETLLGERFGHEKLIHSVSQGMDAMKFGNSLQFTKCGQLHLGLVEGQMKENLDTVIEFFDRAKVPYVLEEDILYRMWSKFMLNVGGNQTCMVYGANYSQLVTEGEPQDTFLGAMREVIALAQAEGINLGEKDLEEYVEITKKLHPEGIPSMAQDRRNGKPTEVELFAGTVRSMAKKHGIPTPINDFLYEEAKRIEKEYLGQ